MNLFITRMLLDKRICLTEKSNPQLVDLEFYAQNIIIVGYILTICLYMYVLYVYTVYVQCHTSTWIYIYIYTFIHIM